MQAPHDTLWRNRDFIKLWIAETISVFGSAITALALPLAAATLLNATPTQMGILGAAASAPFLLVGLFAGVWVDRLRRRPIMVAADIGRGIILGLIPVLYLFDRLSIEYLYISEFLVGVLTVFFDVSYQSYLPALVSRKNLVDGNGKLEISRSASQIVGPGLSGLLIQVLGAPFAIVLDAISFIVSALFLGVIKQRELEPQSDPTVQRSSIWSEIGEGLKVVFGSRYLRSIAGCTATWNLFSNMWSAVFVLYLTRVLNLQPATLGVIFAVGAPGALVGAIVAGRLAQRFGLGATIVGSALIGGLGALLIPLAGGPALVAIPLLVGAQFLGGLTGVVYNVNQVSLRQAITPDRLLGRMNATMRFLVWGTLPIGSLLGGVLGDLVGIRQTLFIGALGTTLAFLWVWFSPVRALQEQPRVGDEPASTAPQAV